jgi:hypothetical protein
MMIVMMKVTFRPMLWSLLTSCIFFIVLHVFLRKHDFTDSYLCSFCSQKILFSNIFMFLPWNITIFPVCCTLFKIHFYVRNSSFCPSSEHESPHCLIVKYFPACECFLFSIQILMRVCPLSEFLFYFRKIKVI